MVKRVGNTRAFILQQFLSINVPEFLMQAAADFSSDFDASSVSRGQNFSPQRRLSIRDYTDYKRPLRLYGTTVKLLTVERKRTRCRSTV